MPGAGRTRAGTVQDITDRQLRSYDFVDIVESALADAGLEPGALEVELTEAVYIEERGRDVLRKLCARGIAVAIDDFGTGFSSLSYLDSLPVDVLKIDRAFIGKIGPDGGAIVGAIVAMAHELGCTVVAERVETDARVDFPRAHGCDILQRFHLGKPVSAELLDWRAPVTLTTGS